ncbi:MAG: class I SAM-dependent rRNA methyltransferase [Bacteroidetes bacterium]|nr:MAG: class I SAM-dependent rRNA methyltransferase [Bacteroidota bacterium]
MKEKTKIILKSGKDDAIKRYHPWVFSGAIKKITGQPTEGSPVEVFSNKDEYLGTGLYQDASIAVRIMEFAPQRPENFDNDFWYQKLNEAFQLRRIADLTENEHTNVYRLIHGEGDHLPGLIIDFYNGNLVIQAHAIGIHLHREKIAEGLQKLYGNNLKSIYYKSRETLPGKFSDTNEAEGFLFGNNPGDVVLEYGNKFEIDFIHGQKTGFFIDQRENRKLLTKYAKDKTLLNTFCYSGGFSVYALQAGAKKVESLDSSKKALELAEKNVKLNFSDTSNHSVIHADAIQFMRENREMYDIIILDPPAFAKHSNVRHNAVQGYKRLNAEAIRQISESGLLFTFSCSQVVNMNLFKSTVIAAAIQAGRKVKILHQMTQPADHPVNAFHPEGEYLKGLVLYID